MLHPVMTRNSFEIQGLNSKNMSPLLLDEKALVRKHGGCISKMQNR